MGTKVTPRLCLGECGRYVTGKTKLCDDCVPRCDCGQRKRTGHRTCYACRPDEQTDIVWVRNRHGILVHRR